ncbi:MAG: M23 family metallopeptidase [Oscillospiraceae bacterium]|jgi:murein DD-endopeptidase MepM/ murein hydrolase activator NlpD|nr:M23 family metallopeptidase [Oscillospiraceae bacterium]
MDNNNNKIKFGKKKFLKGKAFYIALAICLLCVGGAAFTTIQSIKEFTSPKNPQVELKVPEFEKDNSKKDKKKEDNKLDNQIQQKSQNDESKQVITKPIPKKNEENQEAKKQENQENKNNPANPKKPDLIYPVEKNILKEFSESPVYSKTFNDWRSHNGIDLKIEEGTEIKSIADGKVLSIKDDPIFGMVITIEHEKSRIVAEYCGLDKKILIKQGENVKQGQKIGTVGKIPSESSDPTHLHLTIKKDNKFINPKDILG